MKTICIYIGRFFYWLGGLFYDLADWDQPQYTHPEDHGKATHLHEHAHD